MKHLLLSLALLATCGSCYVVRHEYDGTKQITPGTKLRSPSEPLSTVEGSKLVPYVLFGWIRLADSSGPRLVESLATQEYGEDKYDGITRVHITDEEDALGVVVRLLTLGLVGFYRVSVTGEVHRFRV